MRWLLDTCTISESTHPRPDASVVAWMRAHAGDCAVAAASFGKVHYGVTNLPQSARRNHLQARAESLAQQYTGRILLSDEAVWARWGALKASLRAMGRMQDALDLVIAATALRHGLTLVTRNTRYFEDTGLTLLNPWLDSPETP